MKSLVLMLLVCSATAYAGKHSFNCRIDRMNSIAREGVVLAGNLQMDFQDSPYKPSKLNFNDVNFNKRIAVFVGVNDGHICASIVIKPNGCIAIPNDPKCIYQNGDSCFPENITDFIVGTAVIEPQNNTSLHYSLSCRMLYNRN